MTEAELGAGEEDAVNFFKERELDEAAFVVAGLGPGVGEVDVHGGQGIVRDVAANPPGGLAGNDAAIEAVVAAEAVGGEIGVGFGVFKTYEVGGRA